MTAPESRYNGYRYPPWSHSISSPWTFCQVERISIDRRQVRILPEAEWVARTPPMACLFSPWPGEGCMSTTRVRSPFSPRASAVGMPTEPAPTTTASYVSVIGSFPDSGKCADGYLDEQRPVDPVGDGAEIDPLLFEHAPDHGPACLGAAGAHAGAGQGLQLVQVADPG